MTLLKQTFGEASILATYLQPKLWLSPIEKLNCGFLENCSSEFTAKGFVRFGVNAKVVCLILIAIGLEMPIESNPNEFWACERNGLLLPQVG